MKDIESREKVFRDCVEETVESIRENPYFGGMNAYEICENRN
jgi:hypothetical protein